MIILKNSLIFLVGLTNLKMEFGEAKIGGKYISGPKIGSGSFG